MARGRGRWLLGAVAAASACVLLAPVARADVVERAVSFDVRNTNTTHVACASDGARYVVRGHLVYPSSGGGPPSAVTVYLHGLGYGEWFWRFRAVPGYDYATAEAEAGHASVVIDRLGYDSSDHPTGTRSCVGSQADIAHQIVRGLRSGRYSLDGGAPPRFARVGLAGHSLGGLIAEVEAASFHDVDALAVIAFADFGSSPDAIETLLETSRLCALGGEPAEGSSSPGGYAYFGQTEAAFERVMFFDADPGVVSAATPLRNRDPCGDTGSIPAVIALDQVQLRTITVPVLVLLGSNDALFPPPGSESQRLEYPGSHEVTQTVVPDTGHAMTLGRSAPEVRATLARWLASHGL